MRNALAVALTLACLAAPAVRATCGGGGGGGMGGVVPRGSSYGGRDAGRAAPNPYFVPWKIVKTGDAPIQTPLILYWFAASADDQKNGDLAQSRLLTLYSAQCVGMQLVTPDDKTTIEKFAVGGKTPLAILAGDGKEVAHVDANSGHLIVADVENMIHHELFEREIRLDKQLAAADQSAKSGDNAAAIKLYQEVWDQRCLAPKQGREAQKALKKLGVTLKDAQLRATDPVMTPAMNERMTAAMTAALAAELDANYPRARELYRAASLIDPADPVPLRYLGEVYRHHTGEWTLAQQTFTKLLTIQPDPLSRAVALHGLGKMTIHMGDSAKGLDLFEQSIAAYPLALTYRNMAVYWNSERKRDKADGYVRKALALDPDDPYNLIFAATYMADSGRGAEALAIAKKNENVLSASYNLAAIYALLGNKGKAMEMLKRHFYTYERYDAVRAKEMWEARVDYVFASMKDDPDFIRLTAMAN